MFFVFLKLIAIKNSNSTKKEKKNENEVFQTNQIILFWNCKKFIVEVPCQEN